MSKLTFEVGNFYVTRDGRRVLILLIRQGYMVGEIDGENKPMSWCRSGMWSIGGIGHQLDLLAEWVPPKKWVVRVYINTDGHEFMSLKENSQCKLLGSATVTEGHFAKETQ